MRDTLRRMSKAIPLKGHAGPNPMDVKIQEVSDSERERNHPKKRDTRLYLTLNTMTTNIVFGLEEK